MCGFAGLPVSAHAPMFLSVSNQSPEYRICGHSRRLQHTAHARRCQVRAKKRGIPVAAAEKIRYTESKHPARRCPPHETVSAHGSPAAGAAARARLHRLRQEAGARDRDDCTSTAARPSPRSTILIDTFNETVGRGSEPSACRSAASRIRILSTRRCSPRLTASPAPRRCRTCSCPIPRPCWHCRMRISSSTTGTIFRMAGAGMISPRVSCRGRDRRASDRTAGGQEHGDPVCGQDAL